MPLFGLTPQEIVLYRGAPDPRGVLPYVEVADTFLDRDQPEINYGRDLQLESGNGKVLLIAFRDLPRILGRGAKIEDASLELHIESGDKFEIVGAKILKTAWTEGPGRRGLSMLGVAPKSMVPSPQAGRGASFRWPDRQGANWPGGLLGTSQPVDLSLLVKGELVSITGIAQAVQTMEDSEDASLLLEFSAPVSFTSSEADPAFRPRLKIRYQPGEATSVSSIVKEARWKVHPGKPAEKASLEEAVGLLNQVVFPYSRFSFAPEGVEGRIQLTEQDGEGVSAGPSARETIVNILHAIGAPALGSDGSAYPGLSGFGDARDDGNYSRLLPVPYGGYATKVSEEAGLPFTGLLSATEVAWFNRTESLARKLPRVIIVRTVDPAGRPLVTEPVRLLMRSKSGDQEVASLTTSTQGSLTLKNEKLDFTKVLGENLENGMLYLESNRSGAKVQSPVPMWQAIDTTMRSGGSVALFDVMVNSAWVEADRGNDLARHRPVVDDAGAVMDGLTDGSKMVEFPVGKTKWFEIDLGRDRVVAEIEVEVEGTAFWDRVEWRLYGTGDSAANAAALFATKSGQYLRRAWGDKMVFRGLPQGARYLRCLVDSATDTVKLKAIRVYPIKN